PAAPLEARLHPRVDLHAVVRLAGEEASVAADPRLGPQRAVPRLRAARRADRSRGVEPDALPDGDPARLARAPTDPVQLRAAARAGQAARPLPLHVLLRG